MNEMGDLADGDLTIRATVIGGHHGRDRGLGQLHRRGTFAVLVQAASTMPPAA
jgi:hypothetical protein